MKTIAEVEVLECKVLGLENENHRLRHHLTDEYACAALTGLLAHGWGRMIWSPSAPGRLPT